MTKLAVFGTGIMGEYSIRELAPKCDKVYISSSKEKDALKRMFPGERFVFADTYKQAVEDADFVLFCVPTHTVHDYMMQVLPHCKKGAVVSGQTSRKTPEAEAFDKFMADNPQSGLELVTIHSMCNPAKTTEPHKFILGIVRHNCSDGSYERTKEFYGDMSEHIETFESIDEHDARTANTQINTSKTNLAIASSFANVGCFPWLNETYSTALDEMKFCLAMRTANQKAHIYRNIQFGSPHGKALVAHDIEVEDELFRMIVGGRKKEYIERGLAARETLYKGEKPKPILSDEIMKQFGVLTSPKSNSHFSLVQYVIALAESGIGLYEDLKATTPMHTSLVGLADWLFTADGELERALIAPFEDKQLREDDLIFHNQIHGWSDALLFDNETGYDTRHAKMRERLEAPAVREQVEESVEGSKKIVSVCREAMARAIESGRVKVA